MIWRSTLSNVVELKQRITKEGQPEHIPNKYPWVVEVYSDGSMVATKAFKYEATANYWAQWAEEAPLEEVAR